MVDLFFVLSGFVLAPVFPRYKELTSLKEFGLKRFLRLAPLAWITIMFVLVYAGLLEIKQNLSDVATAVSMSIDFQSIVTSLLLLQVFSNEAILINYPLWSLSAEWIVNIVIAIHACLLPKKFFLSFLMGLLFLGVLSATSSADPAWANHIFRAAFGISLGILIRQLFGLGLKLRALKLHLATSSALSMIIVFSRIDYGPYKSIFACLVFSYLIYSVAEFEIEKKLPISESIARNSGLFSFGIYVWHAPLSGLVSRLMELIEVDNVGIFYLALVLVSSIATLISVNFAEKPILRAIKGRLKTR